MPSHSVCLQQFQDSELRLVLMHSGLSVDEVVNNRYWMRLNESCQIHFMPPENEK
uniref:Uncharacterized protein n=1 Tax=Urocitellus parryii TaxID=9999 RepID=A0A8D2GQI6_UROPR